MRSILALTALLTTLAARGDVRLIEPRDGAQLAGGSIVTLEWSGDAPAGAEEWEAFLSVDGGAYFAARVTPHLDARIRSFTFEVPNVTARDGRILLRFGDEEREQEVEIDSHFSIRFDPGAARLRVATAVEEGEPARPGARGVAMWVTGARDGSELRTFRRRTTSCSAPALIAIRIPRFEDAEAADDSEVFAPPPYSDAPPIRLRARRARPRILRGKPDLLLATHRLNI